MSEFEREAGKLTDKIIELAATDVAKIDDCILEDGEDPRTLWVIVKSCRATLVAIRNNTILLEDAIKRAVGNKPVCRREPVDRES